MDLQSSCMRAWPTWDEATRTEPPYGVAPGRGTKQRHRKFAEGNVGGALRARGRARGLRVHRREHAADGHAARWRRDLSS